MATRIIGRWDPDGKKPNPLSCNGRDLTGFCFFMASTPLPALVELRDVTFGYGERAILNDVSMIVPRGKVTALMGASGGGKTTILRLIGGQNRAQKGELRLFGADGVKDVTGMSQAELYAARRRMGMLFQFGALFADLSVFENVAFPLREHTDLPEALIRHIVLMKLNAVGLRGAFDLMPSELSGGMARRVALARAIALDPELIMYDEPFSGLDPISLGTAARLIRQLNDAMGLTSLFVSHELEQTFSIADHIVILANGKVAAQGTPAQVRQSTDPLVSQYVNALPDGPVRFHYPGPGVEQDFGPMLAARAQVASAGVAP
jgi:phospholipid/cholesterol/gamma-HCH transport system ATP-binding protein